MNLNRIRARIETDPFYRMKLRERFEFHMRRYWAALDAGRLPLRQNSRSRFFLGMALSEDWDALVMWLTPDPRTMEAYRQWITSRLT